MSSEKVPNVDTKELILHQVETVSSGYTSPPAEDAEFDEKATKRMIRKMDWNMLPFLALLYLLSFLDRTNIGNARLAGLEKSLGMEGLMYNAALAIFFPFYVAAEIPSNMMLKATRPSVWIPCIMLAWGLCTTLMGIVKSYNELLAIRAVLGVAEGGLFPGVTFLISMWYRRHECGLRMAIFFAAATVAGAFGGLLARGIIEMDGVGGLHGWSWIFILEGIITFIVAVVAFFVMHDYPSTARFLTPVERKEVARRLVEDNCALADEFDMKYFWDALKDFKIWVHMFITIGIYCPLYSISLFLPTIVKGLGYTNNTAQLMSVPPYISACVLTISIGYLADRLKSRGIFMIASTVTAIVGFLMLVFATENSIRYVGTFLVTAGVYPNVPMGVAWNGNNIGGSLKRGVGIAMHVGFGNLGGVVSGFIYRTQDAPYYKTGHGTLIGFLAMSLILQVGMTLYLRRENKRRDATHKQPLLYTVEEKFAERTKGDSASFFRYTV